MTWILILLLVLIGLYPRLRRHLRSRRSDVLQVAFLHPYCNAGGGGERVLYCWIRTLQQQYPGSKLHCTVFTGDEISLSGLLANVEHRFNIEIDGSNLQLVHLSSRWLVEAKCWPRFTMLGQSLGSMVMGIEACFRFAPDLLIDSMGYAFAVAVFKWLVGCATCSYVHYPIISTDMIHLVDSAAFNNSTVISQNKVLRTAKLIYYKIFAVIYGVMGRHSDLVFTNSSWTDGHIKYLWNIPKITHIIYPPCDLKNFLSLKIERPTKPMTFVSIAQFRPEKDHALQIRAFSKLLQSLPDGLESEDVLLDIVGSVRGKEDEALLQNLRDLAAELGVTNRITFSKNVPFQELQDKLQNSVCGLHTMWNEHFGIGIVEMMASGCVVIAHNSGGPKLDIVTVAEQDRTGFLADSENCYANCMRQVLLMREDERRRIIQAARRSISRFSEHAFEQCVLKYLLQSNVLKFKLQS